MAWLVTIVIALWGLPLLTMSLAGLACLMSERVRLSAARIVGFAAPDTSPPAKVHSTPAHVHGGASNLQG